MYFSDFKRYLRSQRFKQHGKLLVNLDDLEVFKWKGNRQSIIDRRSFDNPAECWHVYPIAVDNVHVFIVCPFCGNIHLHGVSGGDYEGHRVEHCNEERRHPESWPGYYIEQAPEAKTETGCITVDIQNEQSERSGKRER